MGYAAAGCAGGRLVGERRGWITAGIAGALLVVAWFFPVSWETTVVVATSGFAGAWDPAVDRLWFDRRGWPRLVSKAVPWLVALTLVVALTLEERSFGLFAWLLLGFLVGTELAVLVLARRDAREVGARVETFHLGRGWVLAMTSLTATNLGLGVGGASPALGVLHALATALLVGPYLRWGYVMEVDQEGIRLFHFTWVAWTDVGSARLCGPRVLRHVVLKRERGWFRRVSVPLYFRGTRPIEAALMAAVGPGHPVYEVLSPSSA